MLEDEKGYIWISHSRGLSRLNPRNLEVINFNKSNGLQGNDFTGGAYFKTKSGRMFFGGANGFNTLMPNELPINHHNAPIQLTGFSKFNETVPLHQAFRKDGILELNYSDSVFGFEFAALDYTKPNDNLYQYKMEGIHDKWVNARNNNRITFSNLADGQYTFRVRGSNNDAQWGTHELAVQIKVLPPHWRTWWAYLSYMLLATFVIAAIIKAYMDKMKMAVRYQVELQQEVSKRTLELEVTNKKLRSLSLLDGLTSIHNRRSFDNDLKKVWGETKQNNGEFLLLLADVDHFKLYNDKYGHVAGDEVLRQIAAVLNDHIRADDRVYRYGGEEFAIIFTNHNLNSANETFSRILKEICKLGIPHSDSEHLIVTISGGMSQSTENVESIEKLIELADQRLYTAKRVGRNCLIDNIAV